MKTVQMSPDISDAKLFKAIQLSIESIPELFQIHRLFSVKVENKIGIHHDFMFTLEFINHELLEDDLEKEKFFSNVIIFSKIPINHWVVFAEDCNVQVFDEENFNTLFNIL